MKKNFLWALLACAFVMAGCSDDDDDDVTGNDPITITDSGFKAYLLEHFDTNKDGEISADEAKAVTHLVMWKRESSASVNKEIKNIKSKATGDDDDDIYDYPESIDGTTRTISSLEGIQYFTNLVYLDVEDQNISTADLSKNTKLVILYMDHNKLTSINLKSNPELKDLILWDNDLTSIDLTGNTKLELLDLDNNKLQTVDFSRNPVLRAIYLSENDLKGTLDLKNQNRLESLDVEGNPNLEKVIISKNAGGEDGFYMNFDEGVEVVLE